MENETQIDPEKGFRIRLSEERCPVCGERIRYGSVPIIGGREFRINCKCEDEQIKKERAERITAGEAVIRAEMRMASGVPKKYRSAELEEIVPSRGQAKAYEAACAFVRRFGEGRHTDGIYFIGGVGSGKTYLSAAVANAVIARWRIPEWEAECAADGNAVRCFPVRFTGTMELFERLKRSYAKDSGGEDLLHVYKTAPLLVLDDLGAEKPSDWTRERLFEIIDYRYSQELPLILTTNRKTDALKNDLGERICDRIREMCVFAPVTAVSQRQTASCVTQHETQQKSPSKPITIHP